MCHKNTTGKAERAPAPNVTIIASAPLNDAIAVLSFTRDSSPSPTPTTAVLGPRRVATSASGVPYIDERPSIAIRTTVRGHYWTGPLVISKEIADSGNQYSEGIGHMRTRLYVNGLQSTSSRSLNVFKDIVKEHNAVCRHADCADNIVVSLGFGLSQPNR